MGSVADVVRSAVGESAVSAGGGAEGASAARGRGLPDAAGVGSGGTSEWARWSPAGGSWGASPGGGTGCRVVMAGVRERRRHRGRTAHR